MGRTIEASMGRPEKSVDVQEYSQPISDRLAVRISASGDTSVWSPQRDQLPVAEPRLGRRTALTFPLLPPPQKN